jgi:hypothetical protein
MRLLYLDGNKIEELFKQFDKDTKALKEQLLKMCWYMRGGVSYTEILNSSIDERDIITEIIEGNLATTKETQLPFF